MKKFLIFIFAILIVALAAYVVHDNLTPSKGEIEDLIYKQAAIVLSYEDTSNPLISAMFNNAEVDVEKVEKGSEGYVASCKIGNYNFKSAYDKCTSENHISTLNKFTSDFISALQHEEKVYTTVQINIKKDVDGNYMAELTELDIDVLMGGFITFCAFYYETE